MDTFGSAFVPSCVDPTRCATCPPDRVCAWACEQGWGVVDVLISKSLPVPDEAPDEASRDPALNQALWESYN